MTRCIICGSESDRFICSQKCVDVFIEKIVEGAKEKFSNGDKHESGKETEKEEELA